MLDPLLVGILLIVLCIPSIIIVATVDRSDIKTQGNYPGSIFNLIPCSDTATGFVGCSTIIVLVIWEILFSATERSIFADQWFFDVILIIIVCLVIGHVCGAPLRLLKMPDYQTQAPQRQFSTLGIYQSPFASTKEPPPPSILLWCPKCEVRVDVRIGERGVCDRCGYVTEVAEWPP
jgi:hypothetical protein